MRRLLLTSLIACLCSANANAALIIYYPLDETSGNVAVDAAIADGLQSATSASTAAWQPAGGIVGGGLLLSPTAQADVNEALIYNTASTATSILSGPPFTITVWFNTVNAGAFNRAAVYFGDSTKGDQYYAVGLNPSSQPNQIARNNNSLTITSPLAANDGQWHQMTAVYTALNSRTFYLDGRQVGATSTTTVPAVLMNRFGIGALTRNTQTDAFGGLLDEVGLFDTALTAQEAALLNAFPRYDDVRLDDSNYTLALSVFNAQTGTVDTGDWEWGFASGLPGTLGSTGTLNGNPYVVLDSSGNGLAAVPEPGVGALALTGSFLCARRRRRIG